MINLSVRDAEFKDRTDNSKDVNSKTAIGRRASGLSHRSSKLGEVHYAPTGKTSSDFARWDSCGDH